MPLKQTKKKKPYGHVYIFPHTQNIYLGIYPYTWNELDPHYVPVKN